MLKHIRATLVLLVGLTVLTGVAYPLVVTGIAHAAFPGRAEGSLVKSDGKVIGSSLIGQPFDDTKYFWGRPSATSPAPYTAFNADKGTGSSGSNAGPLNPALTDAVKGRVKALREAALAAGVPSDEVVPVDLVTASASGLDPDISPAAAEYQVARVASVRHVPVDQVRALIAQHTQGRQWGIFGEPRVNVLELNVALDDLAASASR